MLVLKKIWRKFRLWLMARDSNYYYKMYHKSMGNNHFAYEELQKVNKKYKKLEALPI